MNPYTTLKNKHQKEIDAFPFGWAFSENQFNDMMINKFGLSPEDTDKIYDIGGGGYIRKCDSEAMHEMIERHTQEREAAIRENKDDYLYHMFDYELGNHEYNYTYELDDTLDALDLTMEDIKADKRMYDALIRAMRHQESLEY